ncbi:histidine phosphatase family protein [Agitococcus lubricus]|uniref:Histidine phosphatase superfamily protein (Branch 1) n=1 Tax=Agitococcus lubricus TaxID=1077255 RepID=A0A2T5IZ80_9GAMM|nr:histidine phosphatase family protein [Agitococcus lubricus]PTQ89256.1 histidine phosphatase superfamily protein (branch 1) [Agitococcus lubricus]
MLPSKLEMGLHLLPNHRPAILLTRHSIRELAAPNAIAGYDLPLTPEGILLAEQWGERLTRPIRAFYSSPVGRCLDTAKAMARGAGIDLPITQSHVLVEPGCFVQSVRKVGALFLQMGPIAFANHHLQQDLDGVLSPKEGAKKIIHYLYHSQPHLDEASLTVHVTHDTILAAFIYHLRQQTRISEQDWPAMMEGVWLWFDQERLYWVWRGEQGHVALADYLFA